MRIICRETLTTGESVDAPAVCAMNLTLAAATKQNLRHKKAASRPESAMRFHHADAIATLLAGLWATHVAWRRERITPPGMEALGRPERWIGPLLVAFAVLEFAVPP